MPKLKVKKAEAENEIKELQEEIKNNVSELEEETNAEVNKEETSKTPTTKEKKHNPKFSKKLEEALDKYPAHIIDIYMILRNNAEIRHYCSLGILNYLMQKGIIKGAKRYVAFKYNKFTVICDDLHQEFRYSEAFFLNALVASFASFANAASKTIDNFTKMELNKSAVEIVDDEEVNKMKQ